MTNHKLLNQNILV